MQAGSSFRVAEYLTRQQYLKRLIQLRVTYTERVGLTERLSELHAWLAVAYGVAGPRIAYSVDIV